MFSSAQRGREMIVSLYCQHGYKLRWSRSRKAYVPLEKDHGRLSCVPTDKCVDGQMVPLRASVPARPALRVVR